MVVERRDAVADALRPHCSGRKPFTYLDSGETPAAAFDAAALARLQDIKARRDPDGLFRSNFPVAPAVTV